MSRVSNSSGRPVLDGLYHQLLTRGIGYFLPSSELELVGHIPESTRQVVFRDTPSSGLIFDWLGNRYALLHEGKLSDHEQRMLQSICTFLYARYDLLFK